MRAKTVIVAALLAANLLSPAQGFFNRLGKSLIKETADFAQPVGETIAAVGSSQCDNLKRLLGLSYEQLDGDNEPDLSKLTLEYRDPLMRLTYNIAAAEEMTRSYDPSRRLIIFFHGFTEDPNRKSFKTLNEALIGTGKYNVLALDASSLIRWMYLRCTTYVKFIGERVAELLVALEKQGVDPATVHLIGHSLGAHIAGFASKTYTKLTGKTVGRISGLDPAGPCFTDIDPDLRLKASDADYVDVMHTDAGVFGLKENIGHSDYWPNAGAAQPGCLTMVCSHCRTWMYFAESVAEAAAFPAVKCDSWDAFKAGQCQGDVSYMGYSSEPGTRGQFFLQTRDEAPYSLGETGTRYRNTDGVVKTIGGSAKLFLG